MKNENDKRYLRETAASGWWLVTKRELTDLWVGGRAMTFLILFSILLGVTSFLLATNSELKLLPPREMVFMVLQISISVSLFISLLIAADSISGERERATLEGLLLVPTSRRQIVIGKYLAAMSIWPAAYGIAAAHVAILSPNSQIMQQSLALSALLGSILVIGFTGFGMLVSLAANNNRSSLFVSLFVAVLFLIPTQFPGTAQTGFMGKLVKQINPMESVNQFLEKVLVNNRTIEEMLPWLASPIILTIVVGVLLFVFAAPRLDLDGEKAKVWRLWPRRVANMVVIIGCWLFAAPFATAHAQTSTTDITPQIAIDTTFKEVKTGDSFDFTTTVSNENSENSGSLVVAMNLVNLGDGDPVDPEDWSPERTQMIESLAPGESATLIWTINAILEGNYLAYMVVIPEPDSPQTTSVPVSSQGIHLTVRQFSPLNPAGITPVAFGIPMMLSILLSGQLWLRRRKLAGAFGF
jgi:ABC-type transport system involved in cytochrome c biogenesis permease component